MSNAQIALVIGICVLVLLAGVLFGAFFVVRTEWFQKTFPNANLPSWVKAGYFIRFPLRNELNPKDLYSL